MTTTPLKKQTWQERALQVYKYHLEKIRSSHTHKISDTAKELNRSKGSVAEDILLAKWMSDPNKRKLDRFKGVRAAIEYVRQKREEERLQG